MKEKLICKKCSKNWSRPLSRGRKPHFCPSCSKDANLTPIAVKTLSLKNQRVHTTKLSKKSVSFKTAIKKETDKNLIEGPSHWQCSSCLISVSIGINIYDPPTHHCKKRLNKNFPLEKVSKIIKSS